MLLSLDSVSKIFADREIFHDISIKIEEGDRIGVVGINGAGKTTLLRILFGELSLDEGQRFTKKNLIIGYLRQNSGVTESNTIYQEMRSAFVPLLQAKESMKELSKKMEAYSDHNGAAYQADSMEYARLESYFSANDGYNIDVHIETVLHGMGFGGWDYQTLCNTLSGGEKTKLALAKLLLQKPDLILLDEPTNYLDLLALQWLEQYLISIKSTFVVVSHDRYFLDQVCTHIWDVTQGTVECYRANYSKYIHIKEELYQRRAKEYAAEEEELKKLSDYIDRNKVRASTASMAKSREKKLELLKAAHASHLLPPSLLSARIRFTFEAGPTKDILEIKDLSMRAGGLSNERILSKNLTLHVSRGQRIAILGKNGAGKSTFFQTIMDRLPPSSGRIRWGQGTHISWFEQENSGFFPLHTVLEEVRERFPAAPSQELRQILACLLFRPEDIEKKIRNLSGGEKARLKLAILMLQHPNILLLDEPTNHLDLMTREALDQALMEFGNMEGTVLAITHDRYLLTRMPWRILELSPDGFREYKDYSDYLQSQQAFSGFETKKAEKEPKEPKEESHYGGKKQRILNAARRKRFGDVEREIERLENTIAEKQKKLTTEVYSDYKKLEETYGELEQLQQKLNQFLDEWATLESELKEEL